MGEVYLARLVGELGFEKQLVIKTILPELAEKPRFIDMFAAEAKTAVALSHGNIVPAYELGRAADTFYIAMGYVDGPSVAQLLEAAQEQGRAPDIAAGLHVMRGVLAGLAYAHREEPGRPAVVHRDITPRNILIDRSGQVRIVDFGISAPARRQVGVRAGSIGYMAPEQARGEAADPRADVFSAGCMLYELCTHERAFPKEGVWITPPMDAVPEAVRGPLERALAIDPGARFKDASEMNAALREGFAAHVSTYDDTALARTIASLFPDGWGRGDEPRRDDSGESPVLPGPSETYATRLTAVTGLDPSAGAPLPVDADPTESLGTADPDDSGPHAGVEAPTERNPPSRRPPGSADNEDRGGVRVSSLAVVLGAIGIGVAAFAIGRSDVRSVADDVPAPRQSAAVSAAVEPEPRQAARVAPPSSPAPSPTAASPAPIVRKLVLQPADAVATVDGEAVTDGMLTVPPEGTVDLVVRAKGYTPTTVSLSAAQGDGPLPIRLTALPSRPKEPGDLQVVAPNVAWAEVLVDGKKVGNTPTRRISVPGGRHKVEVRCVPDVCVPARSLHRSSVNIEPGKLTRVDASR
jgi:serine/threonine-protein kinase